MTHERPGVLMSGRWPELDWYYDPPRGIGTPWTYRTRGTPKACARMVDVSNREMDRCLALLQGLDWRPITSPGSLPVPWVGLVDAFRDPHRYAPAWVVGTLPLLRSLWWATTIEGDLRRLGAKVRATIGQAYVLSGDQEAPAIEAMRAALIAQAAK